MNTLIFCHNLEEFYLFYRSLNNSKNFFKKNYFILKKKEDVSKIKKLFTNDSFFYQDHESKIPEFSDYILNQEVIDKFKSTELLFFQNLDFYEFENSAITSKDSRQTYYYYLNNILQFIKVNNFTCCYFSHTPHSLPEIIFLGIFKTLNIKTVFVRGLPIADMYTYQKDLFKHNGFNSKKYLINKKNIKVHKVIKKFIQDSELNFNFASNKPNKWNNYSLVQLYYKFSKFRYLIFYSFFLFIFFFHIYRILGILFKSLIFYIFTKKEKFKNYFYLPAILKKKNISLHRSKIDRLDFERILLRGYIQKNHNINYYYSLIKSNLDLKEKYIFFPLWFQPSSTTYPFAGRMVDYQISINMLSAALPSNFKIFIKESPDIFNMSKHSWFKGNFSRNKSFYSEISKNKKIKFVDFSYRDSELIDASIAVASLCDKFNLIALIRGKPTITFVETSTNRFRNSFYCRNIGEIKNALKNIDKNNHNSNKESNKWVDIFFKSLSENSFYNPYNIGFNKFNLSYDYKKAAKLFEEIIK